MAPALSTNDPVQASQSNPSNEDAEELKNLDDIFVRIKKRTPPQPYLVSTPSDLAYVLKPHNFDDFRRGTNFSRNEAKLDYSSFLYRDTSNSILLLESQDTGEDSAKPTVSASTNPSYPNTPSLGPRKKISLADYKNRNGQRSKLGNAASHTPAATTNGTSAVQSPQPAKPSKPSAVQSPKPAKPSEPSAGKLDTGAPIATTPKVIDHPKPQIPVPASTSALKDTTTPRTPISAKTSPKPIRTEVNEPKESSAGHVTPAPQVQPKSDTVVTESITTSLSAIKSAPFTTVQQRTSMPSSRTETHAKLAAAMSNEQDPTKQPSKTTSKTVEDPEILATAPSVVEQNGKLSTPESISGGAVSVPREDDHRTAAITKYESPSPRGPHWSPVTTPGSYSPTSLQLSAAMSGSSATSADFSLDLPSDAVFAEARRREAAENLQQQKELPGTDGISRKRDATTALGEAWEPSKKRQTDLATANTQKQRRPDDEANIVNGDSKRRKTLDANSPHTPQPGERHSQVAQTPSSSNPKGLVTPARTLKPGTAGSARANTPHGSIRTPDSGTHINTNRSAKKWNDELARLQTIGKSLKKESTALFESSEAAKKSTDKARFTKLSVVKGLESILAFMMAFCAQDQVLGSHSTWRSITLLSEEITKRASGIAHLEGMCHLLRATCCSRSVSLLSKRRVEDLSREKFEEHCNMMQTYTQRAEQFAVDSNKLLPKTVMSKRYPATYKASEAIPFATPTAMPVARMGLKFLAELSENESLKWTRQIEEGHCAEL